MIAISYRREDSAPITGRIYDRLQAVFGRDRVFLDFDSIPFGADFRTHISEALSGCQTLIVVIGPHWLGVSADGARRIDDPTDFVRLEVAQALARDIRVIPLLIDRTDMPSSTVLPDDLKSLAFRNALRVDSGADFHHHIDRLCAALEKTSGDPAKRVIAPVELTQPPQSQPRVVPSVDSRAEKNQQDSVAKEATTSVESTRAIQSQSATEVSGITPARPAPPQLQRLSQYIGTPQTMNVQSLIFVAKWTVACLVSYTVGRGVVFALMGFGLVAYVLSCLCIGVALGVAQWVVLQRRIGSSQWWILATTIGFLFYLVRAWTGYQRGYIHFGLEMLMGFALGAMQWLVLRRSVSQAAWWILIVGIASALGEATCEKIPVGWLPNSDFWRATLWSTILGGVSGVISGLGLVILLQRAGRGLAHRRV